MIVDGTGPHDERFDQIYRKYYGRVFRYFRSGGVSDDESQDLAHDAFKRLYERIAQIRNEVPWPFLATIAKTVLLNYIRSNRALKRTGTKVEIDDPDLVGVEPAAPAEPDVFEQREKQERVALLVAAVNELPKGQRDVLRLWMQGRKYEEIAKILGVSLDAVKSRLRDAKRNLREQLGEK